MYKNNLNNTPLISIAMATYNGEKYLKEQLDSIYTQTYKNIEVIVTDDCSTDKTVEILEEYTKSYGLKYFVNEENLGFVKNFEKAVSLCEGEYIALADQDDIWFPEKLSILLSKIGDHVLACSDAELIDINGVQIDASLIHFTKKKALSGKVFQTLLVKNFAYGCTILMKRELIKKAHPIPIGISYHDWWYALVASSNGGVYFYDKVLLGYRQHLSNDTGANQNLPMLQKILRVFSQGYLQKRLKSTHTKIHDLELYIKTDLFTEAENMMFKEMLQYYRARTNGTNRVKAFKIALKYRDEMYYNVPKFLRIPLCLVSIFV